MKKKIYGRIISVLLVAAMLFTVIPQKLFSTNAAPAPLWTHMSAAEAAAETALYDAVNDTMFFWPDDSMAARLKYTGVADMGGKDFAVEFDVEAAGGEIGVYTYEEGTGAMYGLYLDMNAGLLDAVLYEDGSTCLDNFAYFEQASGSEVNYTESAENWTVADMAGARLRVEFIQSEDTECLTGGTANYYKQDKDTKEFLLMGSFEIPWELPFDDPEHANCVGIQVWKGEAEVSNIDITPYPWTHMSAAEKDLGYATYDADTESISFTVTGDFSGRMNYTGLEVEAGKDYAIEFDMSLTGGAIGIYNYDTKGDLFGVYLDTGALALDAVHHNNGAFLDNFAFAESQAQTTVHPQTGCQNFTAADVANSRLRVEFRRGASDILPGGTVHYYKQNRSTDEWLYMASVAIPENAVNAGMANYFGIQVWLGSGTVSNISVSEIPWIHENVTEQGHNLAAYDALKDTMSFGWTDGMTARMRYACIPDTSGRDYAIEFDMNLAGGEIGVYNYEPATGELYGAFLDTGSGALDALQYKSGQLVDNFAFAESLAGTTVHPTVPCENWTAADVSGSRLRVEFIRGAQGSLAGGAAIYYKWDSTKGAFVKLGKLDIPSNVTDDASAPNHWGIQVWYGSGSISNMTVSTFEPTKLKVGGAGTHTTPVEIPVIDGQTLPVNVYSSGKYILGWTVNGQKVTTYSASVPADKYVADFIDTGMLKVKYQAGNDTVTDSATLRNVRFIASVDDLDYRMAGFVFSLSNTNPLIGGTACATRSTGTVYEELLADGVPQKVGAVYAGGYSKYMFAYQINSIPASNGGNTIYTRAYVELYDGTIVYGDMRAVEVTNNALTSKGFNLKLNEIGDSYGTQIVNASGTVVSEQNAPVILRIKKDNPADDATGMTSQQEMISSYYQDVEMTSGQMTATATLSSSAGSQFKVTDIYTVNSTGGFVLDRDIDVIKVAAADDGFNSIVEYREGTPAAYSQYEIFMPSTIIRDSTYLVPGAVGYTPSQSFILARDTQMGLPMVMMKNKNNNYAFSMGRIVNGNVTTGIDESSANWVVDGSIKYGSTGYANTAADGSASAVMFYPGTGINSSDAIERSHPIQTDVDHSYKVLLLPMAEDSFTDAMVTSYKTQFSVTSVPDADYDIDKVYWENITFLDTYTQKHGSSRQYGMPFAMNLDGSISTSGGITRTDICMGFVGQQTSVAFHLIRSGLYTNNTSQITKGESIINLFVSGMQSAGYPLTCYVARNNAWMKAENDTVGTFRYMSDGMEGILDAYLIEKQSGTTRSAWLNACISYANWLVSKQNADGSYPYIINQKTGAVVNQSKHTTAVNIRFLVRMYEQTGNTNYLNAAHKAGQFVYNTQYQSGAYHGGIPDGYDVLDRESAVMALYGFNSLYQVTGDKNWLDAAEHAAIAMASYVYTYDFTVPNNTKGTINNTCNIYNRTGTSGLSRISTGNWGSDLFAAYTYYEFFKLYVFTGDSFYYEMAELMQDNTKRFINIDGNIPEYGVDGMMNEAVAIANMFYEDDVKSYLPWSTVAMIDPVVSMESAFGPGVKTIEQANAYGRDALLNALTTYGAGGKLRQ